MILTRYDISDVGIINKARLALEQKPAPAPKHKKKMTTVAIALAAALWFSYCWGLI